MNPRIVCAANRCDITNEIVIGIRHYDAAMRSQITNLQIITEETNSFADLPFVENVTQGFIDQFGNFYNRQEAWKIADQNGQILRRVGGDSANGGTLYSENLY